MENQMILAAVLDAGTRILSARILAFISLLMTFGLFCWAIYLQTWIGYAVATTFGVFVFLPCLWAGKPPKE